MGTGPTLDVTWYQFTWQSLPSSYSYPYRELYIIYLTVSFVPYDITHNVFRFWVRSIPTLVAKVWDGKLLKHINWGLTSLLGDFKVDVCIAVDSTLLHMTLFLNFLTSTYCHPIDCHLLLLLIFFYKIKGKVWNYS